MAIDDNDNINEIVGAKMSQINKLIGELNLKLNSNKTKVQFFRRSNRMNESIEININNSLINSSLNVKYLGIIIDQKLNFIEHTNQIIKSVNLRIKP